MKHKWIKRTIWLLLSPIIIILMVMALLYFPPVQNFLREKATTYASEKTGMKIVIGRLDLRFPLNLLVTNASIIQKKDTLLTLQRMNIRIAALPLFTGKIVTENVLLERAFINSSDLIKGVKIKGVLGHFLLKSHGIDLVREIASISNAELSNTHLNVLLNDTTAKDTTEHKPVNWQVLVRQIKLDNVSFNLEMLTDTFRTSAHFDKALAYGGKIDLKHNSYALRKIEVFNTSLGFDKGIKPLAVGFDPSHFSCSQVRMELDSMAFKERNSSAVIKCFSMNERSGLVVESLTGRFLSTAKQIEIPHLNLRTLHSEINFKAQASWDSLQTVGPLKGQLDAYVGKGDVLLLAGNLPQTFKKEYPFRPLMVHVKVDGSLKHLNLSEFKTTLPGAFSLSGNGFLENITDSLKRVGMLKFNMSTGNLNFLTSLTGTPSSPSFVIPNLIKMTAQVGIKGHAYQSKIHLEKGTGVITVNANVDSQSEAFNVNVACDKFQLHDFFPKDSIYDLSLTAQVKGRGFNVTHPRSTLAIDGVLDHLSYSKYNLSNVVLKGQIKSSLAKFHLISDNDLLKMKADGEYRLNKPYVEGRLAMDVGYLNLFEFGIIDHPLKKTFGFNLSADVKRKDIHAHLTSGDMAIYLNSRLGVFPLIKQSSQFMKILMKQINQRMLNHDQLRKAVPTVELTLIAGQHNVLAYYLENKTMKFKDLSLNIGAQPNLGINGNVKINKLRVDTLQFDTVYFNVCQDTTSIRLKGGTVHRSKNPKYTFKSTLTGEVASKDAQIMFEYFNGKGEKGISLGVKARPFIEKEGHQNGLVFNIIPEKPIIAFKEFHFENNQNWIYLRKNKRVYASIDLLDDRGMGFRAHSVREDSVSLQNINFELTRIQLAELNKVMPYLPEISGTFSADVHYIQSVKTRQLSAEASVDELAYKSRRIGDITLGATWLPGEDHKQYLSAYLTRDGEEILTSAGTLMIGTTAKNHQMAIKTNLHHFPLAIANAFVPDQMVSLSGDLDGELNTTGVSGSPLVNGELSLDSVAIFSRQIGTKFLLDNRPVQLKNNRLIFDKFAIYTTGKDPFTIDGAVDFQQINRPIVDVNLFAENYLLINAKRTHESLAYGKVLVDFKSTVRGPLNELKMRGNINVLNSTDLIYIMKDSPLILQDRLGSLVSFTSFNDSTRYAKEEMPPVSLGGMEVLMSIHIDPSVRLRAELSADKSNKIELEGGGDLVMKYTPQGNMMLFGRYSLTGGLMKYALPVIPLKEFKFKEGSYIEWTGNPVNPTLNFRATEQMRASVSDGSNSPSRIVNFEVSVIIKQRLDNIYLAFDLDAPEDASLQNKFATMGPEERGKQAIALMVTGMYLGGQTGLKLDMGSALNGVISSQVNSLVSNIKNANLSFGVEKTEQIETAEKNIDYSFRYSQRLFNDRLLIVFAGKVSTGPNSNNKADSFIDNVSFEYRLDNSLTRSVRLFYDKNYESLVEGAIAETGVGLVLRKKLDHLGELFIFGKKKKADKVVDK